MNIRATYTKEIILLLVRGLQLCVKVMELGHSRTLPTVNSHIGCGVAV
jgi:hypothetical protein